MPAIATLPRLIDKPCWSFNPDGTVMDIAAPDPSSVCFLEIAGTLSRIARFNGRSRGTAYSLAQHSVMGADAILNEGGTFREAALFLLHDAHEWAVTDITRPVEQLFAAMLPSVREMIRSAKSAWDEAIYIAADLPPPSRWKVSEAKMVKSMDDRMCAQEAVDLFGERARSQFPNFIKPKTKGAIRPWGAQRAEEKFIEALKRLIGETPIARQSAIATARSMR